MTNKIRIAGYPQLSVSADVEGNVRKRMLDELTAKGYQLSNDLLLPPQDALSKDVIAALTAAFQKAKA